MFSKLNQQPQEEHKEAEIKEEPEVVEKVAEGTENKEEEPAKQEKEGAGEEKAKEEAKKEKPGKEKKTEKKAEDAKGSKRQKTMQCNVTLLDDTQFECELDVRNLWNNSTERLSSLLKNRLMSIPPHSVCVFLFLMQKHAKGQELLTKVCNHVNLLEKDYFGLANWETPTNKVGWFFCPCGY